MHVGVSASSQPCDDRAVGVRRGCKWARVYQQRARRATPFSQVHETVGGVAAAQATSLLFPLGGG